MSTLEQVRRRAKGTEDLGSVVKTMKTLSAVSIRQYERAVAALADYARAIELGLQVVLRAGPSALPVEGTRAGSGGLGAVVVGSDQGLVGRFNEQIVKHAVAAMDDLVPLPGQRLVVCVGDRAYQHLEDAGQAVEAVLPLPSSLEGVTPIVQSLLVMIDEWRVRAGIERVFVFHNKALSTTSHRPQTAQLLPLDPEWLRSLVRRDWPTRVLPTFTMDRDQLFSALVREYIFVSLYRTFAESLASENASRLASMQQAEKNIEELVQDLTAQYRHLRQTSITDELLDTMSGFEALVGEEAHSD